MEGSMLDHTLISSHQASRFQTSLPKASEGVVSFQEGAFMLQKMEPGIETINYQCYPHMLTP